MAGGNGSGASTGKRKLRSQLWFDNPDNPGGRLPMTGADNVLGLTAGALSLIGLGGAAIMYARKRRGL